MEQKVWWKSKSLWINVALFVGAASTLTDVTSLIPDPALKYVTGVIALTNLFLRFNTSVPLGKSDHA